MHQEYFPLEKETSTILSIAVKIHRALGCGFLEIVYKDAFQYELNKNGVSYTREREYSIMYDNIILPHRYFADFVVFNSVIVEVKAQLGISEADIAQTINYLKCSKCSIGLVINFGSPKIGIKRVVL